MGGGQRDASIVFGARGSRRRNARGARTHVALSSYVCFAEVRSSFFVVFLSFPPPPHAPLLFTRRIGFFFSFLIYLFIYFLSVFNRLLDFRTPVARRYRGITAGPRPRGNIIVPARPVASRTTPRFVRGRFEADAV